MTNGPEPTYSLICSVGEVSAMRLGMMNGTFDDGLPRASNIKPVGEFSVAVKVLASTAFHSLTKLFSFCPIESRAAQRLIDATTSSAVTGLSSWNSKPSRSVKLQTRLSGLTLYLSTICGLISPLASIANSVS
jgi:hypothetical protein